MAGVRAEEFAADYRNRISTVDSQGKRRWVYPKRPKGRMYNIRTAISVVLFVFLFAAPFISIGGEPLVLLNFLERRFVLLGIVFWPQDLSLLVLFVLSGCVGIILFTAVFGRLWCGFACPQIVLMEMLFRRIEYAIDGGPNEQRRLAGLPWNGEKVRKRLLKHVLFFLISLVLGHALLAYVIGGPQTLAFIARPPREHLMSLSAVLALSAVMYFVFSWFREQACAVVCPYGRFQSVLVDDNSFAIHYDEGRGEPRFSLGARKAAAMRGEIVGAGSCVDCDQCTSVCPTGIDIRNGWQLECVGCMSCLDACNAVMDKTGQARGLIRMTSAQSLRGKARFRITLRIALYFILFIALTSIATLQFVRRPSLHAVLTRAPGSLAMKTADGRIANRYELTLINVTRAQRRITLTLGDKGGEIKMAMPAVELEPQGVRKLQFFALLPAEDPVTSGRSITLALHERDGRVVRELSIGFVEL